MDAINMSLFFSNMSCRVTESDHDYFCINPKDQNHIANDLFIRSVTKKNRVSVRDFLMISSPQKRLASYDVYRKLAMNLSPEYITQNGSSFNKEAIHLQISANLANKINKAINWGKLWT